MTSNGELTAQRLRATASGETAAAAIMTVLALPLTVVGLMQALPEPLCPGQVTWFISLCVLLHAMGFFCCWRPIVAFIAGSTLMLLLAFTIVPGLGSAGLLPSSVVYLLLVWRLATSENRRHSLGALATGLVGAGFISAVSAVQSGFSDPMSVMFEAGSLIAALLSAWALGALTQQYRLAESRRSRESMQHAIGEERARISRDLHDVVSHALTVMIAQAEAARIVTASHASVGDPETDDALERVAESGREAMRGLRSMINTLQRPDAMPLKPASGIEKVNELIENARSPEHSIELTARGAPERLPPDADIAAFRVVQEGVTNAIRHLRSPVRIDVSFNWRKSDVVITVSDDGGRGVLHEANSNGTGLIGLTERVQRADGTLEIDQSPGWRLRATLPVEVYS